MWYQISTNCLGIHEMIRDKMIVFHTWYMLKCHNTESIFYALHKSVLKFTDLL
jgi:hypothetical protein